MPYLRENEKDLGHGIKIINNDIDGYENVGVIIATDPDASFPFGIGDILYYNRSIDDREIDGQKISFIYKLDISGWEKQ